MEDWHRDYNEVRPRSAIGNKDADIAVEWLVGAPVGTSLTPETSSISWPSFGERFKGRLV
jgi:hypothetical protein